MLGGLLLGIQSHSRWSRQWYNACGWRSSSIPRIRKWDCRSVATEVEHFKQRKYFVIQGDRVIERCVLEGFYCSRNIGFREYKVVLRLLAYERKSWQHSFNLYDEGLFSFWTTYNDMKVSLGHLYRFIKFIIIVKTNGTIRITAMFWSFGWKCTNWRLVTHNIILHITYITLTRVIFRVVLYWF